MIKNKIHTCADLEHSLAVCSLTYHNMPLYFVYFQQKECQRHNK